MRIPINYMFLNCDFGILIEKTLLQDLYIKMSATMSM
jgi:hypothetical protein